jgi:hypothetical protein
MSAELRCPRCGRFLDQYEGQAASIGRRYKLPEYDQFGRQMSFVPLVNCLIRACLDPQPGGCTFTEAGHNIDGIYVPDLDLVPLTEIWERLMEDNEDQQRRRDQKCDPGE